MLANLSGWHLVIILFIVLLLFGAPKLPGLAKSVGESMKIFKKEIRQDSADGETTTDGTTASTATPAPAATSAPAAAPAPASTDPAPAAHAAAAPRTDAV